MADRQIPVIDISNFTERKEEIVAAIMKASEEMGFFSVVGHGIPAEDVTKAFGYAAKYFALPDEVKAKNFLVKAQNVGWEKMGQVRPSTGTTDLKESLQMGYCNMEGKWPADADCDGFEAFTKRFMAQVQDVSMRLLSCFAIGLDLPEDFFVEHHDPSDPGCQQTLRMLHYFDISGRPYDPAFWRAGAHTDFDTLTLLFQRVGQDGLEVCPGRNVSTEYAVGSVWSPVPPVEDAITINIGDMLMQWSDDRFKSNFHRVRTPRPDEYTGPRYSLAYFNQANKGSVIVGPKKKYAPVTGGEFILAAMRRNYAMLEQLKEQQAKGVEVAAA
eukprot:TRINITY_DN29940_c0_g1_i1.p1 TRINITY_DN29940_c0_g1~~TRINITY_DN29940_c0_g1_i1.p1  ORF type:complete len:328 (-),score=89.42 TRINITY_DN29940_c0_g1_i1:1217-2200(-)